MFTRHVSDCGRGTGTAVKFLSGRLSNATAQIVVPVGQGCDHLAPV
jgi:hypothetical protein